MAALYIHRPPYAAQIYQAIVEHSPSIGRLLDLGCGEGKIARPLAKTFREVVAVDPSAPMIALGRSLENGRAANIDWIEASAEKATFAGRFDTVTFASSIHWMDPGTLFPKLKNHVGADHLLAIVSGDTAFEPPWEADWQQFLERWVPEVTGRELDSEEWRETRTKHLDFVDVLQVDEFVSEPFQQSVEGFILCQHSRNTFTIKALGSRLSDFRDELKALLQPHADHDRRLSFRIKSHLTLARLNES